MTIDRNGENCSSGFTCGPLSLDPSPLAELKRLAVGIWGLEKKKKLFGGGERVDLPTHAHTSNRRCQEYHIKFASCQISKFMRCGPDRKARTVQQGGLLNWCKMFLHCPVIAGVTSFIVKAFFSLGASIKRRSFET